MSVRSYCFIAAMAAASFTFGCGGSGGSGSNEPLVPVGGTLLVDGKPLDGVVVTFIPQVSNKASQSRGGAGTTDATGAFTVTSLDKNLPGLPVGNYTFAYSRMRLSDGSPAPELAPGTPHDPAKIRVESLPVHLTTPNAKLPVNQVTIPAGGNTKLELKISTTPPGPGGAG